MAVLRHVCHWKLLKYDAVYDTARYGRNYNVYERTRHRKRRETVVCDHRNAPPG
jgi:hypothetical protein